MTATTKPPDPGKTTRRRRPRFSSLEIFGFSDSAAVWSDSPVGVANGQRAGHHHAPPEPDTMADWRPKEFEGRLTGGDVRWGLVVTLVLVVAGLAGFGFWLYQQSLTRGATSVAGVTAQARALDSSIPALEEFNDNLLDDPSAATSALFAIENEARALIQASSELASTEGELRATSEVAAGSAIDGIRLASASHAYRSAVLPILATPALETNPALIELDEAARQFGDWQLGFDEVRGALPDGALSRVTDQLDVLSGDLASILGRYVDALRRDDMNAAAGVVSDLDLRLTKIDDALTVSIQDVQTRVEMRIEETRESLDRLLSPP